MSSHLFLVTYLITLQHKTFLEVKSNSLRKQTTIAKDNLSRLSYRNYIHVVTITYTLNSH